jgi:hypothetical protein
METPPARPVSNIRPHALPTAYLSPTRACSAYVRTAGLYVHARAAHGSAASSGRRDSPGRGAPAEIAREPEPTRRDWLLTWNGASPHGPNATDQGFRKIRSARLRV